MKSQVTLKMIAQKLNLSTSTVSRALADQWDVNSQTKKIVTDLAIELNFMAFTCIFTKVSFLSSWRIMAR